MKLVGALVVAQSIQWAVGRLNRIEPHSAEREIQEYGAEPSILASSSASEQESDVGILSSYDVDKEHHRYQENRNLASSKCNSKDIINCVNGFTVINNTMVSCADACDRECCEGTGACSGFDGYVCKDTISCMGAKACQDANISSVLRGCNGNFACTYAAERIGVLDEGPGFIGEIIDSCLGERSCKYAGAEGGVIGEVIDSCVGKRSCYKAAGYYGVINSITSSCVGGSSCNGTAYYGVINSISSSCNAVNSCKGAGSNEGYVEFITDSCNAANACEYLGLGEGDRRKTRKLEKKPKKDKKPKKEKEKDEDTQTISLCVDSCCNVAGACESVTSPGSLPSDCTLTSCKKVADTETTADSIFD